MSDANAAQQRRQAQNRKAQREYRKREAARAAQIQTSSGVQTVPQDASNEVVMQRGDIPQVLPGRQLYNFTTSTSPATQNSPSPAEWSIHSLQQIPGGDKCPLELLGLQACDKDFFAALIDDGVQNVSFRKAQQNNPKIPGRSPLHLAAMHNFPSVCHKLIGYGAALEAREEAGRTPLHVAVISGSVDAVAALVTGGAMVDAEDSAGMTPLYFAVNSGYEAIVEILLSNGADPNHTMTG